MRCEDARSLLDAHFDGELSGDTRRDMETHLQHCPVCTDALRELQELRAAIHGGVPYLSAPDKLREQVRLSLRAATYLEKRRTPDVRWQTWATAAALLIAVGLAWTIWFNLVRTPRQTIAQDLVATHIRAMMGRNVDVASTDQHTVKPWFNGKVPYSPPVRDLAASGYPLVGGRRDFADGRVVAVLVYQRRLHVIDVFVWPASGAAQRPRAESNQEGYNVVSWTDNGFAFWAVSDLNAAELGRFAELLEQP